MSGDLTVATFNLHWGRGAKRHGYPEYDVVAACRRLDADVLVLQESWTPDGGEAQHAAVAAALGHRVVAAEAIGRAVVEPEPKVVARRPPTGANGGRKGTGDWCVAVLSRLPAEPLGTTWLPELRADPASRAVLGVEVDVGGRPLVVCGTHLPHLEAGAPLIARALRRALPDPARAAVLLGDMNMWRWCIGPMAGRGWSVHGRGATFPASRPFLRIDHVLTTGAVRVRDIEVVPDLGSDHRPVRARLEVAA